MRLLTPIAKRLTVAMSIGLILMGVVVSGHAMAAHVNGLTNGVAAPCHHAMVNDAGRAGESSDVALDLCRQLCLNKIPDTAVAATAVFPQALVQSSEPAPYYTLVAITAPSALPYAFDSTAPPERTHSSPPPRLQRLLI